MKQGKSLVARFYKWRHPAHSRLARSARRSPHAVNSRSRRLGAECHHHRGMQLHDVLSRATSAPCRAPTVMARWPSTSAGSTWAIGSTRAIFGPVSLNGIKFWIAGDLGADFSKGANWAEITFEPSVTKEQRDAITTIVPHVYPVTWKAFTIGADAPIAWTATNDRAEARLNGGNAANVVLRRNPGMTADPVVDQEPEVLRRAAQHWIRPDAQRNRSLSGGPKTVRVQGHQRVHDHLRHHVEGRQELGEVPRVTYSLRSNTTATVATRGWSDSGLTSSRAMARPRTVSQSAARLPPATTRRDWRDGAPEWSRCSTARAARAIRATGAAVTCGGSRKPRSMCSLTGSADPPRKRGSIIPRHPDAPRTRLSPGRLRDHWPARRGRYGRGVARDGDTAARSP